MVDLPNDYDLNGQVNRRKAPIPTIGKSTANERLAAAQQNPDLAGNPVPKANFGIRPMSEGGYAGKHTQTEEYTNARRFSENIR